MESEETSGVPRGGPIYLPNMVGPLSKIPEFHNSLHLVLQDLETYLSPSSSSNSREYDVSTDALKLYTEEELIEMAVKEAFREDRDCQNYLEKPSGTSHLSDGDQKVTSSEGVNLENCAETANNSPFLKSSSEAKPKKKRKMTEKKSEEAFLTKVEQLAQIKKMQDEVKATVELHCLKTCVNVKSATASSEGFERMQSLRSTNHATKLLKPPDIKDPLDMRVPEVILCIEIYNSGKTKTQEFLVLGCQKLTELKDKIHCRTDQVMTKAGKYDRSGYFLIEDIFYNDLRNPSAIDYSKPMLDWLWHSKDEALRKWQYIVAGEPQRKHKLFSKEVKPNLPHFGAAEMSTTRFCDLRFRLGASYLYCHQGDCKHMIVIRDMRLIHPDDDHNRAVYPRLVYQRKRVAVKCGVCKINRATKLGVDDKWAKKNPCYFCNFCFDLLHSEEGPLCCDFPLYDYIYG